MRIAFAIVDLFPHGGLQRDCLAIAEICAARGHDVTILTARLKPGVTVVRSSIRELPVEAWTNVGRDKAFGRAVHSIRGEFDRVIGFNKLPFLDIYYAGDRSFAVIKKWRYQQLNPRYRAQMLLERACFAPRSTTRIIVLAREQRDEYRRVWSTPAGRFRLVPPNLDPRRRRPETRSDGTRSRMRREFAVGEGQIMWLSVGTRIHTKGIDRSIAALGSMPDTVLAIAGIEQGSRAARSIERMARNGGVAERLRMLGPREDIVEVMAAADLLVHPARIETTGTVILEAIANGLPVVATTVCGFACHVRDADAGIVLSEPYRQKEYEAALDTAKSPLLRERWERAGIDYGSDPQLSSGHEISADLVSGELW